MLDADDARILARWCRNRRLSAVACAEGGMTLESWVSPAWNSMRLVESVEGLTLLDGTGETLASASDLPALLDAVDAGVAEPRPRFVVPLAATAAFIAAE